MNRALARTPAARISLGLVYVTLTAAAIITAVPFVWMICAALKTNEDFFTALFLPLRETGGVAWDRLTLSNFTRLFTEHGFAGAMLNSVFLSSTTAVLATLSASMAGYALARFEFKGRSLVIAVVLGVLVVPGTVLLAPSYQLLFQLGLLDTFTGLILPAAAPAFGVFLFRQAVISSVPAQLIEAARIDGAGEWRIYFQIALPLLRPMVGAFLLVTFLGAWNNFIGPQIVLQTPERFPLAVAVSLLRGVYYQDYGLQMAGTLVSVVPVLALFLLLQKEFIAGLTSGAVKG
ncbi:MAG: carbohydrate ABC transporter permease [Planctomycetota bacterium]|nr:carbohydrate ABC transporter permease [Planctomycetota bacterium]